MKKLNFFNKIVFLVNNLFAILLVLSFFVPNIKPSSFSLTPIIGLTIPIIILANVLFVIYWIIIGFKKQFLVSALVLLLGYFFSTPIYKFSSSSNEEDNNLKIMSYNVRKFNKRKWTNEASIPQKISEFIAQENPDILALQEYAITENTTITYPYTYNPKIGKRYTSGLAFYSKYPIIDQGRIFTKKHEDRIIYIDILKNKDTLRIYNFHLQSLGLVPEEEYLGQKNSDHLISRLKKSFKLQEEQLIPFHKAQNSYKGKSITVGDLNNTAYSWVYKNLKGELKDSYLEEGSGFGKTYNFRGFPLRIDYILVDKNLSVTQHKNYTINYSDHTPIMATVSF